MELSDDEIEQAVDAAFLRLYGRTYREDEPPPHDSLDKIMADFPQVFKP